MVKNVYPQTTLQPQQKIDFHLTTGEMVRTLLSISPSTVPSQISHVDVDATMAGSPVLNRLSNAGAYLSIMQAGVLAHQYVQGEANRLGAQLKLVELQGEEFLEQADVISIIGNVAPVNVS
jgi:hypothetical protein